MLNKENYVPLSSRLLRYAKSRPNRKLIHNSILNGPYVRKMIPEPGDANRDITVTETFHLQTDDELSDKELKQIEADDQAIQTILLGLPEDIYAAVDSCETAQEIWLRVQQMMKGSDIGIQEKKAKLFNEWERKNYLESVDRMPSFDSIVRAFASLGHDLDIYASGFDCRPPMLNKENYVPWLSRFLWYAKSRPNGKLIQNSILNGLYVRRMIPEPGDANREVTVTETFYMQIDDELSDKEIKQIEADDQAIQTILLSLSEDIYAAVDSCETALEIWLRVQQMMKGSDIGIQKKKAKLFNEWERFTSNEGESIESYDHRFLKLMTDLKRNKHFSEKIASNLKFLNKLQPEWSRHVTIVHQTKDLHTADYTQLYDFLKYNQKENYLQQPMLNPEDITDPTTIMNMAKAFKLNYSSPTNNNQRISSNPRNRQIAQLGMNMGQDRQMQMVGGNGGNWFRQYAWQHAGNPAGYNDVIGNQVIQNAVHNPRVQNIRNQNGIIGVQRNVNQNQIGNGNLVAARAEGNVAGPMRRDAAYLQTHLLIAQKEEAGIQLQAEEYDLMDAAVDLDKIEEVNANCILMANL
uniref:Gag-Pol polyprotein n=1 Tax=Tanacetum cinerariifolium TaxID=118510 RepID=A0A699INL4_TANCI|nr:hypothetical protein [Tanacetum cinerariifolium]